MILPLVLRFIRRFFRLFEDSADFFLFRYSLCLNRVKHEHITCFGLPYIAVAPKGTCIIGDNFRLSNGARFNPIGYPQPCQLVVTDGATLRIGKNVGISQASIICHHSITIGDYVKIGGGVKIYDTNFHSLDPAVRRCHSQDMLEKKCAPVFIDHDAFIGAGSIILSGVTIGANSVIAAGSVVVKNIPSNEVWGGNPAKYIKTLKI